MAPRRTPSVDTGDVGSMPSLGSEELSPAERKTDDVATTITVSSTSVMPDPNTAEKTAVHALLMAAMAMTEMSGTSTTNTNTNTNTNGNGNVGGMTIKQDVSTPPGVVKQQEEQEQEEEEETYETPQKNLLRQFQSPKRKQSETAANPQDEVVAGSMMRRRSGEESSSPSAGGSEYDDDEESPKREHPGEETPSLQQKIKRSRIGSLKKTTRNLGNEMADDHKKWNGNSNNTSMVMETPKTKGEGPKTELTPVSARCIDFRKMHVNEAKTNTNF